MKTLLRLFLLLAFLWIGGFAWFAAQIPSEKTPAQIGTADAIVVLTGGTLRLERGFELLMENHAPKMFVSGVEDKVTLDSLLHKKEYEPYAGRITPSSVELGHQARTTFGNAVETSLWSAQNHIRSIILVTGSYHLPRSIFELHMEMPEVTITPAPVFPNHFAGDAWWRHADSIKLVISEYHKYITSHIVSLLDA